MKRCAAFLLVALAGAAMAQDRAEIDQTKIIGNRELPKVLYIVPWKKPAPGQLSGKPAASVLDEVLAPVDREVFRRQVAYQAQTQAQAQAQVSAATQPSPQPTTDPEPQRRAP
jgi:hypothetical protein